ncbi:TetR/AcrR family transcriptional regulator [Nocardia sp. NPDC050378]|uniref:TetR/AcrR family transcriptional regulator n=1 Tax=Nocardia sp. NPDC050378 TaxID=3155400 RepID=UPI0033D5F533
MPNGRARRADAQKNYETLIRIAQDHLNSQGVSTSLEAIAREAGVGVGTFYRHFPDRDHLIFAALNAQGEELRAAAGHIRAAVATDERLDRWLAEVERYFNSYYGLPASLAHALADSHETPLAITCHEIIELTDEFLVDAQRAGAVRAGICGRDLFDTILMVAWLESQVLKGQRGLDGVRDIIRNGYVIDGTSPAGAQESSRRPGPQPPLRIGL